MPATAKNPDVTLSPVEGRTIVREQDLCAAPDDDRDIVLSSAKDD
jgi:hypothetical protein